MDMPAGNSEREITATRMLDAPRELVFRAFTELGHLEKWWGPDGFTTTTFAHDVRPGGVWRFVMHGPDGRDYHNKITFVEVVPLERLVYRHGGDKDVEPVSFEVTVTFEDVGGRTRLDWRMLFPSKSAKDRTVKTYGAEEGLRQTLGRMEAYVAALRRA